MLLATFLFVWLASNPHVQGAVYDLSIEQESHTATHNATNNLTWPYQSYESSPFHPPKLSITSNNNSETHPLSSGYLFFSPGLSQSGPGIKAPGNLIMTDLGQLIWADPNPGYNIKAIEFEGSPALLKWDGDVIFGTNEGHGYGGLTILNQSYEKIRSVCPKLGLLDPDGGGGGGGAHACEADFHEAFVTERDTLLVTAYNATPADLSFLGGPEDGWVFDGLFFEIEARSQEVLFRWSALEHVPLSHSKQPLIQGTGTRDRPYDFFHINSVEDVGGRFLVSARHTWSVYFISDNGSVEWTLRGDNGGDFGWLPDGANFEWQHHARAHKVTNTSLTLTLFANNNHQLFPHTHTSTGLTLFLSLPPSSSHPPILLSRFADPQDPLYADFMGSFQVLPNHNALLSYGGAPIIKEFSDDGAIIWTARFGYDDHARNYRVFKQRWKGRPSGKPSLVVRKGEGDRRWGYVSWNGVTEVERWEIWGGDRRTTLNRFRTVRFDGFETKFGVLERCVKVFALEKGERVGESDVVCDEVDRERTWQGYAQRILQPWRAIIW